MQSVTETMECGEGKQKGQREARNASLEPGLWLGNTDFESEFQHENKVNDQDILGKKYNII